MPPFRDRTSGYIFYFEKNPDFQRWGAYFSSLKFLYARSKYLAGSSETTENNLA